MNPFETLIDEQQQQGVTNQQPRPQQDNPFLQLLEDQERQGETALKASVSLAAGVSPDRAAESRRIAARTGQPVDLVERNFEEFTRRDKITSTPFADIMRQSPALAESLKDPNIAAIVQDDLENLGFLEWLTTAPQRAFSRGMNQLEVARLRTKQMQGPLTQDETDLLNSAKYHMQRDANLGTESGGQWWARGAVAGLASQLPNLFGAALKGSERSAYTIPAAFAAGAGAAAVLGTAPLSVPVLFGAGLTAGMMTGGAEFSFEIEAGLAFDEFLEMKDELGQPMDPETAKVAAIGAGALNAGLEVVGLGILVNTIPGIDKLKGDVARAAIKEALRAPTVRQALSEAGKTYVATLGKETAVEVAQRFFTVAGGELAKFASGQDFEHLGPGEWASDLTHEALSAVQTFSLLSAPGPTLSFARDTRRAKQAAQNEGFFQALGQGVTASKTFERQPAAAQEFIARATKDGPIENVYAPIDTWTTYWQGKNLDPAQMAAEVTGNPNAYAEAKATGVDLTIPTAAYAVKLAGTEHNTALAQELRLAPDAMNARESKEFVAEQEAAAAEAAAPAQAEAVRETLLRELQFAVAGTGIKLPPGALETYADAYQAILATWQQELGIDPVEFLERYGLEVRGPAEKGPAAAEQQVTPEGPDVDDLDSAVAAAAGVPNIPESAAEALRHAGFIVDTGERRRETDSPDAMARAATGGGNEAMLAELRAEGIDPSQPNFGAVLKERVVALSADPTAREGARVMMRRLGDINAAREAAPPRDVEAEPGAEAGAKPEATAAADPAQLTPAQQAQQLLEQEFPQGSVERDELVNLRRTSSPEDFKEFLQGVFTPTEPADAPGLHAIGGEGGPEGLAWGTYFASARSLLEATGVELETETQVALGDAAILNWDAPASQQPPAVQQALRALGVRWTRTSNPLGGEIYKALAQITDLDPTGVATASSALHRHGVIATRFNDGGIANYIAFDKHLGGAVELWQSERPKGYEAIAQHLTPAERDKLKRDHAERMVAIFKELPSDLDFSDAALAGVAKRGWYKQSAEAIRNIFGNVDGPRFSALLAAMSPQTSVESNLYNAVNTWKNWVKAGRPTTRAAILKVMARSVQGDKGVDSVLASWVPNTVRALSADEPMTAVLLGPKVHSFYRNLIGEMQEVTNDAWMSSFALIDKTVLGGSINKAETDPGKGPGYLAMVAKIRRVAKRLSDQTGETWTPAEVQETVWSWAKTLYELAEAEGTDAETIVREGRLTDQAIASTPDFKTLFTSDPTVRAILEAAGYGEAISALETELGGSVGGRDEPAGTVDVGTGSEGRPATLGTLRSARRLDALRRQRQEAARLKEGTELRQELRPAFYSRLVRTVEESKTGKATGAQWKATIRNSKLGINVDEFTLTEVNDLEDGKAYTREEVLQYLRTHRVQVGQVVLGDPDAGTMQTEEVDESEIESKAQEIYDRETERERERAWESFESQIWMRVESETEEIDADDPDDPDATIEVERWHVVAYQGSRASRANKISESDDWFDSEDDAQEWLDSDEGSEWRYEHEDKERDAYLEDYEYDYTWAEAEQEAREEVGSQEIDLSETHYQNWSLEGPHDKRSYREAFVTAETVAEKSWQDGHDKYDFVNNPIVRVRFNARTGYSVDDLATFHEQQLALPEIPQGDKTLRREGELEEAGVPKKRILFVEEVQPPQDDENIPALFKKNWREIGFKWALRWAAEHGFDAVAWTTGAQQQDRYSLTKKVERIKWTSDTMPGGAIGEVPAQTRVITINVINGGDISLRVNASNGEVMHSTGHASQWAGDPLSAVLGKELAEQILVDEEGIIAEEGLKVGGVGLAKLYDVDFPNVVKNLPVVKKHKGTVSRFSIGLPTGEFNVQPHHISLGSGAFAVIHNSEQWGVSFKGAFATRDHAHRFISSIGERDETEAASMEVIANPSPGSEIVRAQWRVTDAAGVPARVFADPLAAERYADQRTNTSQASAVKRLQPGIEITPEMRTALMGGQALFQPLRAGDELESPGRGRISIGPNRQHIITLFKDADVSTFMHESAHLFLEMMQDLAAAEGARPRIATDMQVLRDWFFPGGTEPIGVREHEMFARAFERYLMEGKAPSVGLRGLFNQFRAWLMNLYRQLAELDVELTDDVRGVFDRMFATDRAILEAQDEFQVTPMFTTPEQAGMSPEEFGRYQATIEEASRKARETLEAKLLQEVRRAQTAAWRAQADDTRREVEAEVHQQPVYQALAAMRRGTRPDGSPIVEGVVSEPLRLSRAIIVERFGGEQRLQSLPRPFIYSAQGGLDPDVVGQMFGFPSGDALLQAVAAAPPMRQVIEQTTEQRMRERYGDLVLEDRIPEEAKAALANDQRDAIIRAELRALGQLRRTVAPFEAAAAQDLQGERRERAYERRWMEAEARLRIALAEGHKQVEIDELRNEVLNLRRRARGGAATVRAGIPSDSVLRDAARQRIGRTRIRDLRPATFWSAARRSSTKATELAATGDYDGAIVEKQNELINLALYRQASFAKEQADKRVRQMMAYSRPSARSRLGLAGQDYLDQVDGILDRYDFARATQKVLDRRQALRAWADQLAAAGLPVEIASSVLDDARRIHYRDLSFDELVAVTDGVQQIAHLARLKLGLLKKKEAREFAAAVEEVSSSIRNKARKLTTKLWGSRLPQDEALHILEMAFAAHRKMSSLARELDGFEDGGAVWEYIIQPLNDAADQKAVRTAAAAKALHDIVGNAYVGREKLKLYEKTHLPEIGASLTKMERLMVALHSGNEGNRQRLMRGHGLNEAQLQVILGTLDQRDWQFVQAIWDHIDSYWQDIVDKQRRVTGLAPTKVEALPVKTKFGEQRGGYFPVKWDPRISPAAKRQVEIEAARLEMHGAYVSSTTARGHIEERRDQVGAEFKLRLDFGVIFEHVNQVIHDLTHHEALVDVNRILGSAQVRDAIYEAAGEAVYDQFTHGVKAVASGDTRANEGLERPINHIRMGTTVAMLGWSLSVPLLQPIGLTQSVSRIGGKWVARGMARWLRDASSMQNTVRWINEKSKFMRMRGQTQNREINEIRNKIGLNTGRVSGYVEAFLHTVTQDKVTQAGMADSFFYLIQQAQRIADVPTWLGQYEKSMAAGESEERAIQLADQAVIDSQGSGYMKDMAAVQRGPAAWKLWTNFYSFFSTTYQLSAEATARSRYNQPGAIGRLAVDYMLIFIIPATLSYFVREGMKRDEGDDDKDLLVELAKANLGYLMGTMMGLREVASAVQSTYGYEGPAGAALFPRAARLINQVKQGELDQALWRSAIDTAGILFHFPTGQTKRTIEGIVALIEGRTNNPGALISGPPAE